MADPGIPRREAPTPEAGTLTFFLQKNCRNCMKMKEIGLGDVPNTKVKET